MANSEYTDLEELGINCNDDEITKTFTLAANHLTKLVSKLDNDTLLNLYGYYKQGLEGPCNTPKPSWYDMKAKSKWEAWNKLKDMPQNDAKVLYINLIKKIDPLFDSTAETDTKEGWVTVSTLHHSEETTHESDKTIIDYVKEGNSKKVNELLPNVKDINSLDTDGLGLIHWATDRGFHNILQILLKYNCNINLKDVDGQTALHYASSCGHLECIELLIKNGADMEIVDADGMTPITVAVDDTIKDLLSKHS